MFKGSNSDKIQRFYNQILTITEPVHHSNRKAFKINHSLYQNITKYQPVTDKSQTHGVESYKNRKGKESVDLSKGGLDLSPEKIYNSKKNAYKTYIRDIYIKINEELRKKNNFLAIASQNIKHIDYSNAVVAKQVKPLQILEEQEEKKVKKRARERIKISKNQVQDIFRETMRQKMKSTFKIKQEQKKFVTAFPKKQIVPASKTDRQMFKIKKIEKETEPKIEVTPIKHNQRRRERIYSLNSTINVSNKITVQNFIPASKTFNKKQPFVCGRPLEKVSVQQKNKQKIISYVDFIWKINYANGLFVKSTPEDTVYRAYVGPGNNSNMVKSILKRRFWWNVAQKPQDCNFVWTQLKINSIFKQCQSESKTSLDLLYCNIQEEYNPVLSKGLEQQWDEINFHTKIFNSIDFCNWISHINRNSKNENIINQRTYLKRVGFIAKKNLTRIQDSRKLVVHNHLEHNYFIGNKKALFYHMKNLYKLRGEDVFNALPITFHVSRGMDDPQYKSFIAYYNKLQESKKKGEDQKNIWILKPGQFSNRGNGITVCHSLDDILLRLKSKQKSSDGNLRTFILQKYIQKPLLYKNRKFDIRHYLLLTCFNGIIKAYWYPQGYIRTASAIFSLKRGTNMFIHLTNDAIQQHSDEYGKYQKGNKISYQKFQAYLDKTLKQQKNVFYNKILPEMKELSINAVKATYLSLDQKRRQHNFELLGMDFMIDSGLKPWLIEINTNPCLELSCPLLARIIPNLVENTFQICIDPLFPPPQEWPTAKKIFVGDNMLQENRFELIFDESTQGKQMQKLFKGDYMIANNIGKIQQDADVYEGDGVEQWEGDNLNHTDIF